MQAAQEESQAVEIVMVHGQVVNRLGRALRAEKYAKLIRPLTLCLPDPGPLSAILRRVT